VVYCYTPMDGETPDNQLHIRLNKSDAGSVW
jgi:hypothetical protein